MRAYSFAAASALVPLLASAATGDEELQKQLANPVADLVTFPIQYTATAHVGPFEKPLHALNLQPVYPTRLGADWNLINRVILPLISTPAAAPGEGREHGIGDVVYEGFFSPAANPGGLIWGVGPAVQLRTASDPRLGSGKWAAGPTMVAIVQPGKWTAGALVTQLWSFAGAGNRPDMNQLQLQPIFSYRLSPQHSIGYLGIFTANWDQPSGQRWTVPIGATYSILARPSWVSTPVNFIIGAGKNIERPSGVGDWFFRFQVNFVFPK